jgi:hypothetical protein
MTAAHDTSLYDFTHQLTIISGFSKILLAEAAPHDSARREGEEIQRAASTALQRLDRLDPGGLGSRHS